MLGFYTILDFSSRFMNYQIVVIGLYNLSQCFISIHISVFVHLKFLQMQLRRSSLLW
jgi:hypothetical protein